MKRINKPWFRMYARFITDPVVEELSFEDQRHFVFLLCMKCDGLLDKEFPDEEMRERSIARRLGLQGEAFTNAKQRLIESALIDANWHPINWDRLQFVSDSDPTATDRKRRQRAKSTGHADVTRDAIVTVTRTDTDTDTEQTRGARKRATRRAPAEFEPDKTYAVEQVPDIDAVQEVAKFRDCEFKTARSDWPAVWRNWIRRCKETGQYAKQAGSGRAFRW